MKTVRNCARTACKRGDIRMPAHGATMGPFPPMPGMRSPARIEFAMPHLSNALLMCNNANDSLRSPFAISVFYVFLLLLTFSPLGANAAQKCLLCHAEMAAGFASAHTFAANDCTRCHGGDPDAGRLPQAHRDLIAFPGGSDNAATACGGCHDDKVQAVAHSLMQTGGGMVRTTRRALGEPEAIDGHADLAHLTHSPADSLLRKQCASCHLGQKKRAHRLDPMNDRGGGCLACHINDYPKHAHPALSATVSDARCFGCHSRSGRISLSYAGLAETDTKAGNALHLPDGRTVEHRPADVHYTSGMGCIDCHTEVGIMGIGNTATHKAAAVDIGCADCHDNRQPTIDAAHWPARFRALLPKVPFKVTTGTRFLVTTRHRTPLWNVELRKDGAWLHPKRGGPPLRIPPYTAKAHPMAVEHSRLRCDSCHSQWAPQCYSCHLSYDATGAQWDHVERTVTPGAWHERRGDVRSGLPPLGVDAHGKIVPVVPGMIMTATHPDWPKPKFLRRFAALAPHTTGPARDCASCHRSSTALGLGTGRLARTPHGWAFAPAMGPLQDGLPADAWTALDRPLHPTQDGVRPLTASEMRRILDAAVAETPSR